MVDLRKCRGLSECTNIFQAIVVASESRTTPLTGRSDDNECIVHFDHR
jgi:hypothetical protein